MFVPFSKWSLYMYVCFFKMFLWFGGLVFSLYYQPYLVYLVLFAYSQYTLLLKEIKDKNYCICFGVRNSQVLCGLFGFVTGRFCFVLFVTLFLALRNRKNRSHIKNSTKFLHIFWITELKKKLLTTTHAINERLSWYSVFFIWSDQWSPHANICI